MRNPPLCQVVDASGAAHTTSFHLTRSSVDLRTALGRISSPRFLIRYTCRREQKQRAGNGSDVIFLLVALNCCHAGTIGAIPYVNLCCILYLKPPHTISTPLMDHVLGELFNYGGLDNMI